MCPECLLQHEDPSLNLQKPSLKNVCVHVCTFNPCTAVGREGFLGLVGSQPNSRFSEKLEGTG